MDTTPDASEAPEARPSISWKGMTQKTWVILLLGLLLPPAGMILVWLKPGWSNKTRLLAMGLLGLVLLGRYRQSGSEPDINQHQPVASQDKQRESRSAAVSDPALGSESQQRTPMSSDERAYYRYGIDDGRREGKEQVAFIKDHEASPEKWSASLLQRVADLKREMEAHAESTISNQTWNSRGRYEGFLGVVEPWLQVAEAHANAIIDQTVGDGADEDPPHRPMLQRKWFEAFDKYVERVITTTLASFGGTITQSDISIRKDSQGMYQIDGTVHFEGGGQRRVQGWGRGSDFGWVASKNERWATTDDASYWDRTGKEMSRDEFCSKWMGSSFLEVRRSQWDSSERSSKQNIERLKKIYEGLK